MDGIAMRNRTSTMLHMNIWRQHAAGPLHVMLCCLTFCHLPLVIENGKDKSLVMAIQKAGDLKKKAWDLSIPWSLSVTSSASTSAVGAFDMKFPFSEMYFRPLKPLWT